MVNNKRAVLAALLASSLSAAGVVHHTVVSPQPVRAQTAEDSVPRDLVNLFAKVVLEIEPYRVEALEASNNAVDDREKDGIQRDFIRQATEIVEANGLAVADYNRITIQLRQDDELREQIEAEIRGLQQNDA
ncbi:MAG: DUF4168 domain-containing protein [Synechococcus sp.]